VSALARLSVTTLPPPLVVGRQLRSRFRKKGLTVVRWNFAALLVLYALDRSTKS
jgi:hypothetical protein